MSASGLGNFYVRKSNIWQNSDSSIVFQNDGYDSTDKRPGFPLTNIPDVRTPEVGEAVWNLGTIGYYTWNAYVTKCYDRQGWTVQQVIDADTIRVNNKTWTRQYAPFTPGPCKFLIFSFSFPTAFSTPPDVKINWKNPFDQPLPDPDGLTYKVSKTGVGTMNFTVNLNSEADIYYNFECVAKGYII